MSETHKDERDNDLGERSRIRAKVRDWFDGKLSSMEDDEPDMPFDGPVAIFSDGQGALFGKEDTAKLEAGWDDLMTAFDRSKDTLPIQE